MCEVRVPASAAQRPRTAGFCCGELNSLHQNGFVHGYPRRFSRCELPALRQSRPDTQSGKLLLGEAPLLGLLVAWPHTWVCLGKQFTRHDNQQPTNKNSL